MDKNEIKAIQKEFSGRYMYADAGTIEGGDADLPVRLISLSTPNNSADERTRSFGCKPGEEAILAEYLPVGMTHDAEHNETGVDPSKIPPRHAWVIFPKSFRGLPVYYKRGYQAFAQ